MKSNAAYLDGSRVVVWVVDFAPRYNLMDSSRALQRGVTVTYCSEIREKLPLIYGSCHPPPFTHLSYRSPPFRYITAIPLLKWQKHPEICSQIQAPSLPTRCCPICHELLNCYLATPPPTRSSTGTERTMILLNHK